MYIVIEPIGDFYQSRFIGKFNQTMNRKKSAVRLLCRHLMMQVVAVVFLTNVSSSQETGPLLDLRSYGVDIPAGRVRQISARNVLTQDSYGNACVAKVHVAVGEYLIVKLPDGQLVPRKSDDVNATERPFVGMPMDDLARELRVGPLAEFKVKKSKHYIYIYNTSEAFNRAAVVILESMFNGVNTYVRNMGAKTTAPDVPLVVIMFKSRSEYQEYFRIDPSIIAYYHILNNRVVMCEETPLARVDQALADQQLISTIAHEGVHQILHNIGAQSRMAAWPMWITEGFAEYLAPTTVGNNRRWKGAGQINDMRMMELEVQIKARDNANWTGDMISESVTARQLTSVGYATSWGLTHYLAKMRRDQFRSYLQELFLLQPLEGNMPVTPDGRIPRHLQLFQKHFGDDLSVIEQRMVKHLDRLPYTSPFADRPHVGLVIAYEDTNKKIRRIGNVFHNDQIATQWQTAQLRRLGLKENDVRVMARTFANRAQAVQAVRETIGN